MIYVVCDVTIYVLLTFANTVLAKFVDTTCIFRDAGAAVGQGSSKIVEGNGNMKNKKSLPIVYVSVH